MQKKLSDWKAKGNYFNYNGHKIFYIKEGSGPVLTIFHGYPYNSFDFEKMWDELTAKFTVVVPDILGMGFSDKPKKYPYSFDEMADFYTALIIELLITEIHILAHGLGNNVVQELLARNGESKNPFLIKSIAFLNGGLFADAYKPQFIQIILYKSPKPIGRVLSRLIPKKCVSNATAEVFGSYTKPSNELLQSFWEIFNYNNGKSIAYFIGRLVFEKEKYQCRWIEAMQDTAIPMCFINGPNDPSSGMHMAVRYNQLIPNANIKLLDDNIGHWPQIEAPQQVLKAHKDFYLNLHDANNKENPSLQDEQIAEYFLYNY